LLPVENVAALMQTVSPYLGQPIEAVVPSLTSTEGGGLKIEKLFFATADLWAQVAMDGTGFSVVRRRAYWIGWIFNAAGVQGPLPTVSMRINHAQTEYSTIDYVGKDAQTWTNQIRALFPADALMG
jgi:hypothetical protein